MAKIITISTTFKGLEICYNHPKDLIIGDVSKGVTSHSKLHDLCGHFAFISHIEPKNILEAEVDSYWLLAMQEVLAQKVTLSICLSFDDNKTHRSYMVLISCLR